MNPIKYTWMCINNALTRNQNPIQKLEGASRELDNMLMEMKLGLVNMVESRNIMKTQMDNIQNEILQLKSEITSSLSDTENTDNTKRLIRQKLHIVKMHEKYSVQKETLMPKIDALVNTIKQLESERKSFILDKKLLESDYTIAKKMNEINVSNSGLSTNVDLGVVNEIQERIENFNANSDAISELTEIGVLDNKITISCNVNDTEIEAEFERLKNE
ncbi:MAG: hypothetical protein KAS32_28410 [Candidatus Peribacteraceae bacterium]|nr:hypothetical protein [Candidatus Peribacteraceae bacterium]